LGDNSSVSQLPDKLDAITLTATTFGTEGVLYALIGGLAVGIRSGVPRATLDVNLAVPSRVDREWLSERLTSAGLARTGTFPHSLNFKHSSGEPVQLAFDPLFDPMIERAETLNIDGLALRVVTKDDLIAMKRRAAADPKLRRSKSLRDQADIAILEGDVPEPNEGW
jgi:predicted nucleotidyltransferase